MGVILCCLPEQGRREIEEIVEMKKRNSRERKMNESEKSKKKKNIPPLPLPATRSVGLAQL